MDVTFSKTDTHNHTQNRHQIICPRNVCVRADVDWQNAGNNKKWILLLVACNWQLPISEREEPEVTSIVLQQEEEKAATAKQELYQKMNRKKQTNDNSNKKWRVGRQSFAEDFAHKQSSTYRKNHKF